MASGGLYYFYLSIKLKLQIKPVSVKTVEKTMKKMAKKKSKGRDNISQECLILGLEALAAPLTEIIITYQLIVSSLQLGYVLIDRTPPYITRLEAQKQGLAFMWRHLIIVFILIVITFQQTHP